MGKKQIKVLHIDSEKLWRGGQQQAVYLFEALLAKNYVTAFVCQPHSVLAKYFVTKKLPCFPISMRGEIDVVAGWRISCLSKKHDFNILHLHSSHALTVGLWAKLFQPKLKLVAVRRVDFHLKKNLFSQIKYHTKLLDKIICISDAIRKVLLQHNIKPGKLLTIRSGIDIHKFSAIAPLTDLKKQWGISEDHLIVGTVAAMAGHKDYPNLLKAAKMVLEKCPDVTFCAVGDGPEREKIYQLAEHLNLQGRFIFTGFQENIGPFLKIFDIFVLASRWEGLGTSILDAQAVGLPIVACKSGGIPEIVIHGQNGILVPPHDEQALAEAIRQLVIHADLRKKLGHNSLRTVKDFDIEVNVQKNIELYQSLIH